MSQQQRRYPKQIPHTCVEEHTLEAFINNFCEKGAWGYQNTRKHKYSKVYGSQDKNPSVLRTSYMGTYVSTEGCHSNQPQHTLARYLEQTIFAREHEVEPVSHWDLELCSRLRILENNSPKQNGSWKPIKTDLKYEPIHIPLTKERARISIAWLALPAWLVKADGHRAGSFILAV